jgi:uncharacterized protein (TIGR02996 family)
MIYKNDELGFLDTFFGTFNNVPDRTCGLVYADWMEEHDMQECHIIRALCDLDADRTDHMQLKKVHSLNHRSLFETIEAEQPSPLFVTFQTVQGEPINYQCAGDKGYPCSTIVNGWKTNTISYFPPMSEDPRAIAFITLDFKLTGSETITAGSWTHMLRDRNGPPGQKKLAFGDRVSMDAVPGVVKKAMFIGYLNHVRKDAERRCGFGAPKINKRKKSNAA